MYDMHYDLLTILYFNMTKNNKFANMEKLLSDLKKIYRKDNILGGLVNLYFMTPEEMEAELDISLEEMQNMKDMLLKSIQYLNILKGINIIPEEVDFIYSIEGCDYIKDEKDLEDIYRLGVRSILPVWNHQNQYGSGNRTDTGLTEQGKALIKKAIDLGMIVDISHANEKTFNGILDVYETYQKENSCLIASHSNVRSLCNRKRNLNDKQLIRLKEAGGYICLFTNGSFLSSDNAQISYSQRQENFLKHLDYVISEIKFDIDKIMIATDDMNYSPYPIYHHKEAFPIETIREDLFNLITGQYDMEVANKIMKENAKKLILKVRN